MKLRAIHLITLLFFANFANAQKWVTTRLNDFAIIDFPVHPERKDSLGMITYITGDSTAIYLVNVKDLSLQNDFEMKKEDIQEFYKGIIQGELTAAGGRLLAQKDFEVNGLKGVEIQYSSDINPQLPRIRYSRILYVNGFVFTCNYWTSGLVQSFMKSSKDQYFESFSITLENGKQYTEGKTLTAFQLGYITGKVLFYLILAGALFLLIWFLTKAFKK